MDQGNTSLEQVRQAVRGDTVALKLLLVETHQRLGQYLVRRMPGDLRAVVDAEDILQETHIEVFRRIRNFEPRGADSFDRWVATIALSRLRNAIQSQRTLKRGNEWRPVHPLPWKLEESTIALLDSLAGPGHTPSRSVARREAVEAVQTALAALPEHYRKAVWLVRIEERSVAEAAAEMGRTERAIHGLCRRGLELLRRQLGSATQFFSSAG